MKHNRLDSIMVEWGFAPTRAKAQEWIVAGAVEIFKNNQWQVIEKASSAAPELKEHLRVQTDKTYPYVSRGGLKLEHALKHFKIDVSRKRVLDLGQSTGGFTDCLLRQGAKEVIGIDVGHGQLHGDMKKDNRVKAYEGFHIEQLLQHKDFQNTQDFDLVVADMSFISTTQVFPLLAQYKGFKNKMNLLYLVKPQFEVGQDALNKKGVVKDQRRIARRLAEIDIIVEDLKWIKKGVYECPIKGQEGNVEFFYWLQK